MALKTLTFAFILALLIVTIINLINRQRGPWGRFWVFLVIEFLGTWTAGLWVRPVYPQLFDVNFIPMSIAGTVLALVLVIITPLTTSWNTRVPDNSKLPDRQHLRSLIQMDEVRSRKAALRLLLLLSLVFGISIALFYLPL